MTRRPRRARTALLTASVAFLAGQLAAAAVAARSPFLRDPLYADKASRLRRCFADGGPGRPPYRVLMLGSSRTAGGFHGRRMEEQLAGEGRPVRVFNFGIPAAGPVTQLLYLRRLRDEGVRPDLLLVEVMPPMLADLPDGPLERQWLFPGRLWRGEVETLLGYGFPAEPSWAAWRQSWLLPAYGMRSPALGRVMPSCLPWAYRSDWSRGTDDRGWLAPDAPPLPRAEYARQVAGTRAEYAPRLAAYRVGGPACRALEELLATAVGQGLPTVLVLMPEGSDFRSWYPADADRQLGTYLDGLCRRYGAGFTDARGWVPDEGFVDSHHLLAAGAVAFTDRLACEAVLPRLRRAEGRP
jgi:hypothetical protein